MSCVWQSLARKEGSLVEHKMTGLKTCRQDFGLAVEGFDINGSLHMTFQSGVLIATLQPSVPRCGGRVATSTAHMITLRWHRDHRVSAIRVVSKAATFVCMPHLR